MGPAAGAVLGVGAGQQRPGQVEPPYGRAPAGRCAARHSCRWRSGGTAAGAPRGTPSAHTLVSVWMPCALGEVGRGGSAAGAPAGTPPAHKKGRAKCHAPGADMLGRVQAVSCAASAAQLMCWSLAGSHSAVTPFVASAIPAQVRARVPLQREQRNRVGQRAISTAMSVRAAGKRAARAEGGQGCAPGRTALHQRGGQRRVHQARAQPASRLSSNWRKSMCIYDNSWLMGLVVFLLLPKMPLILRSMLGGD